MVSSIDDKRLILKNKINLRNESNPPQVKRIFITPDLTPLEQKRNKRLKEELANLNKDGRKYIIKNGMDSSENHLKFTLCTDNNIHNNTLNLTSNLSNDNSSSNLTGTNNLPEIHVLSLNCCSIRNQAKQRLLHAIIDEHRAEIIIGCESHLDNTYLSSEVFPPHFNVIRKIVKKAVYSLQK